MEQANNIQQLVAVPEIRNVPSVSTSAMLIDFGFSCWGTVKKDKTATKAIANGTGAAEGSVEGRKDIMSNEKLDKIRKHGANKRNQIHYKLTLAWSDQGQRLLPTTRQADYIYKMSEAEQEYWVLVNDFLADYDFNVSQRQANAQNLGTLWRAEDYPPADELRKKFGWSCVQVPLPESGDFRLDIAAEAQDVIKQQYETHYANVVQAAMGDLWKRVHDNLTTLLSNLALKDGETDAKGNQVFGRMSESVFQTAKDMIGMLRDYNLTGDTQMTATANRLDDLLYGMNTEVIKGSETLRIDKAAEVKSLIDSLPTLDF
tara:strand:- start:1587 stop:2534 length:948 start_codon:yes stop_codon:yes gene_type:complete